MKKVFLGLIIAMIFCTCAYGGEQSLQPNQVKAVWAANLKIYIDGKEMTFSNTQGEYVAPVILNNMTYIPVRAIGEIMGKNVSWNEMTKTVSLTGSSSNSPKPSVTPTKYGDNTNREIIVQERSDIVVVTDGVQRNFSANGSMVYPIYYQGTTYLPLRAIGVIINKHVIYDEVSQSIYFGDLPENVFSNYQKLMDNSYITITKINTAGDEIQSVYKSFFEKSSTKSLYSVCLNKYDKLLEIKDTLPDKKTGNSHYEIALNAAIFEYYECVEKHFKNINEAIEKNDLETAKTLAYDNTDVDAAYKTMYDKIHKIAKYQL